jgi:uncharacterized protein YndB with AHSA1/START domain
MSELTLTAEPGSHEIVMTRVIAAPRDRVFQAYTDPEMVAQWWGMEGITTIVDTLEARKGGSWRFIHRGPDGSEYAFNGVYHDVTAPERLVYTFEFEPMPGHVLLETVTFEEQPDGTTKITDASVFQSVADRDGMLNSGMEQGAAVTLDRLEALLKQG